MKTIITLSIILIIRRISKLLPEGVSDSNIISYSLDLKILLLII